mmetsp:Transcript_13909/g.33606  ORF Transcript_13909/g.33606 Transcript_13909/m.33606 type:complete len:314 (-) Transcript_13909:91-1032(-)
MRVLGGMSVLALGAKRDVSGSDATLTDAAEVKLEQAFAARQIFGETTTAMPVDEEKAEESSVLNDLTKLQNEHYQPSIPKPIVPAVANADLDRAVGHLADGVEEVAQESAASEEKIAEGMLNFHHAKPVQMSLLSTAGAPQIPAKAPEMEKALAKHVSRAVDALLAQDARRLQSTLLQHASVLEKRGGIEEDQMVEDTARAVVGTARTRFVDEIQPAAHATAREVFAKEYPQLEAAWEEIVQREQKRLALTKMRFFQKGGDALVKQVVRRVQSEVFAPAEREGDRAVAAAVGRASNGGALDDAMTSSWLPTAP